MSGSLQDVAGGYDPNAPKPAALADAFGTDPYAQPGVTPTNGYAAGTGALAINDPDRSKALVDQLRAEDKPLKTDAPKSSYTYGDEQFKGTHAQKSPEPTKAPEPTDTTPLVGMPQSTPTTTPDQLPAAKPQPSLVDQLRAQGGGGGGGSFNPYANQIAAATEARHHIGDTERALSDVGFGRQQTLADAAKEEQRFAGETKQRYADQEAERAAHEKDLQAAIADSKKNGIDEFWASKSSGQKVAGFLAAAFGGFLQGFRGLPSNPGLDQINHEIAQYVNERREGKRAAIEGQRDIYQHFLDKTHNANTAAAMTHASLLESFKTKLDAAAAKTDDIDHRAALQQQSDSLGMQVGAWKDAVEKAKHTPGADPVKLAGEILALRQKEAEIAKINAETGKVNAEVAAGPQGQKGLDVNLPGGGTAQAINPEAAQDYTQRMLGAQKYEEAINGIKEIRKKHGGGTLNPADRAVAEGLAADAKTAYVQMNGFKRTPNDTEFHALDKIIPPNGGEFSPTGTIDQMLDAAGAHATQARRVANETLLRPGSVPQATNAPRPSLQQVAAAGPPPPPPGFKGVGQ